jgi:radical SAM superfamily enzyme YgiQ (UPF0313 family)
MTKVMLADFLYSNNKGPSYFLAPLNIGYMASYAKKVHGGLFDFRLYRDVDKFIKDFNAEKPDIIGFARYIWNDDLSKSILKWIEHEHPKTITICGGPMIGASEESAAAFLDSNPLVDFCVTSYGEYGFSEFLQRYIDSDGNKARMKQEIIPGVSFRENEAYCHSIVDQFMVKPDEIPSPYLTGLLDPFLAEGYSPIIQGMRGCPYSCTMCFASELKIGKFSDDRVLDELDYIYTRTDSSALAVTDDNFGLYDRDIEIAKRIRSVYDERGYPNKLLMYYSKNPTQRVYAIAEIMGDLAPFFISYQSRNAETLKVIKRYNLKDENTKKIIHMCREKDIRLSSEMIFGLPNETKQSFMNGIEQLYDMDLDTIAIYHCKFFNGTDVSSKASIETNEYTTNHRFYEDNFGVFSTNSSYGDLAACETDEIPVESSSFTRKDFLDIRILGFWIELCLAKQIYWEAFKHMGDFEISPFKLIYAIIDNDVEIPSKVRNFLDDVKAAYRDELFSTQGDLKKEFLERFKEDATFQSKKINLYYCYLIMYTSVGAEFSHFVKTAMKTIARDALSSERYDDFVAPIDEIFNFQLNKAVSIDFFEELLENAGCKSAGSQTELVGQAFNQGSDNSQRFLMEGTRAAQANFERVTDDNDDAYQYKKYGDYTYDFISWEKESYSRPINNYKLSKEVHIEFSVRNPKQFEALLSTLATNQRPFKWHNYIYSNNTRCRARLC